MLTTLVLATAAAAYGPDVPFPIGRPRERFVYNRQGRRDPFLFRGKARDKIIDFEPHLPAGGWVPAPRPAVDLEPGPLTQEAEKALQAGDYRKAKRCADLAQQGLGADGPPELAQKIEGLRKAAELLALRKRAEEEFENLPLKINAILWNPDEPVAVINGRTRRQGDLLDNQLQIDRIEKTGVVFVYRNFLKVHKRLNWSFGPKP